MEWLLSGIHLMVSHIIKSLKFSWQPSYAYSSLITRNMFWNLKKVIMPLINRKVLFVLNISLKTQKLHSYMYALSSQS